MKIVKNSMYGVSSKTYTKVICICNEGEYTEHLTLYKTYDVFDRYDATNTSDYAVYQLQNDIGHLYYFDQKHFIEVEEYRNNQINKILSYE